MFHKHLLILCTLIMKIVYVFYKFDLEKFKLNNICLLSYKFSIFPNVIGLITSYLTKNPNHEKRGTLSDLVQSEC